MEIFFAVFAQKKTASVLQPNGTKRFRCSRSHDRLVRSSSQGHISIGSMLSQGDDGTFKGPGIFFYTKGMPVMLLENLLTPFKLVNGRIGKAVDVVVEHIKNVMELRFGGRNFRRMSKSVRSLRKKRKRPARIQKFFIRSDSDVFDLNDRYVLCSRPPACVIAALYLRYRKGGRSEDGLILPPNVEREKRPPSTNQAQG